MLYRIRIKKSAEKALLRLSYRDRVAIDKKLQLLAADLERDDLDIKKLKGEQLYRLRQGDYRIIYQKQRSQLVILVVKIAHRKEAYR